MKENSYGIVKRYQFISEVISKEIESSSTNPIKILDVGCGTGDLLTIPLVKDFKRTICLYAIEKDNASLAYLKDKIEKENIDIYASNDVSIFENVKYHLIIISEVLEHVDDPKKFILNYRKLLEPEGKIILTLPNGYGFFEIDSIIWNLLSISGILSFLINVKRVFIKSKGQKGADTNTLADSYHINFFSYSQIKALIKNTGFMIEIYAGRTFICGPFISSFLNRLPFLFYINNYLGFKLHPVFVSAWMFVLKLDSSILNPSRLILKSNKFNSGLYATFKRYLNSKAHNL